MAFKNGENHNPTQKNETGITKPSDFSPTPAISYSIKPKPETVQAKFSGLLAKCGHCGHGLGEFVRVEGMIKCKESDCKTMNIVKK